jgi:hypothetical protein
MALGSVLVGMAVAIVVGAYIARPLRGRSKSGDQAIEAWVGRARPVESSPSVRARFCHSCGHEVEPGDRFCSSCGTQLREDR